MPTAERVWQESTNRLARQASLNVSRTYLSFANGEINRDEMIGIQATFISTAQRRATTANDILLAMELSSKLEQEHIAFGLAWHEPPDVQAARLSKALDTVLSADVAYVEAGKTPEQRKQLEAHSVRQRLDRLTVGETIDASQWSRQEAMIHWEEKGSIVGWYRRIGLKACDFCKTLGGSPDPTAYVHPVHHRMARHLHCMCSQAWVNEIEPWQKFVGPKRQMATIQPPKVPVPAAARTDYVQLPVRTRAERATAARAEVANLENQVSILNTGIANTEAFRKSIDRTHPDYLATIQLIADATNARRKAQLLLDRAKASAVTAEERLAAGRAPLEEIFESLPKGAPRPIGEVTAGTNPKYATDPDYTKNCTRCVVATEMRARGWEVTAASAPAEKSFADVAAMFQFPGGGERTFSRPTTVAQLRREIMSWPVGARGFVGGDYKKPKGVAHIWNVERTAEGFRFHESQDVIAHDPTSAYLKHIDPKSYQLLQVNDLLPTQDVADWVEVP